MGNSPISAYIELLEIRLSACRRNLIISGGAFLIAFLGFFAVAMLDLLGNARSIYLSVLLLVFLGISSISGLIRFEIVNNALELARVLSSGEQIP